MTPPPDPVAAPCVCTHPESAHYLTEYGDGWAPVERCRGCRAALDDIVVEHAYEPASLSHVSEREALVAAEARVAVLVEAIPEDPWMTEGPIEYRCYAPSCRARVVSGHHPDEEGWSVADHERECEWVTARAALRGQR